MTHSHEAVVKSYISGAITRHKIDSEQFSKLK